MFGAALILLRNVAEHNLAFDHRNDAADDDLCLQHSALWVLARDSNMGRNHERGPHSPMGHRSLLLLLLAAEFFAFLHTDSRIFPDSATLEAASTAP